MSFTTIFIINCAPSSNNLVVNNYLNVYYRSKGNYGFQLEGNIFIAITLLQIIFF